MDDWTSDFWQQVNKISPKRKKKFGKSSDTVIGCCCVISIKDLSVPKILEKEDHHHDGN
jgi:S-methylmethionine-dependent homocysteine/selenocysteine methylase